MPRPKTKTELLAFSQTNYQKLNDYLAQRSAAENQQDFQPGTLNRNVRDVLGHLHHWHVLFLNWYKVGMQGQKPEMPATGYTWKTTSDLNRKIQEKYSETPLESIQNLLNDSYQELQKLIEGHSEIELFEKKYYPWTGSTSLGAYLVSATSSHYDWGLKLIKKASRNPH